MNKKEYWQTIDPRKDPAYKKVHEELQRWKAENNITARCHVHHRDETRQKMSAQIQATTTYKENNGKKSWNDFRKALKQGDIAFEMQPANGGVG